MLDMAVPRKQRPGGKAKPKRKGRNVNVWLNGPLGRALESALQTQRPRTDLTGMVEAALEEYLSKRGFWPLPEPGTCGQSST